MESFLFAGLGNFQKKYVDTRHNVGFKAIDFLSKKLGAIPIDIDTNAKINLYENNDYKIILAKPKTYMNISGSAIKELSDFYNISLDKIIIICDDIYLPFGDIRIRKRGGSGGHNGLKSIINSMKSQHFTRIKIGIGRPEYDIKLSDYVLQNFLPKELEKINDIFEKISLLLLQEHNFLQYP
jgi:peptidyl-tRNA hydrolase, PTH1 family